MPNPNSRQKFADIAGGQKTPPAAETQQGQEGGEGQGADGDAQQGETGQGQQEQPKPKYTDADVDGIVKGRLAREREKLEREIRESIAQEQEAQQSEAEKLQNMTELQRVKYEAKKLRAEKEALEAERDLSQQMGIARRELAAAGITMGDELLSMFVSAEAEKTGAAIDKLKELWPKAVNEAVQQELKRTPPEAERQQGGKSFGASFAQKYSKQQNGGK